MDGTLFSWEMNFFRVLVFGLFSALPVEVLSRRLELTALISNTNSNAAFQCWEFNAPFSDYPTVGTAVMGLANVSNISYIVLPPHSGEGIHKPPQPM